MKNIQFTSRETDLKVLIASSCLGFAAVVGFLVPVPSGDFSGYFIGPAVSVALAVFVWSVFHLIKPDTRKWTMTELAIVPVIWLLLMLTFGAWSYYLCQGVEVQIQERESKLYSQFSPVALTAL